jgi:hypothetical protein
MTKPAAKKPSKDAFLDKLKKAIEDVIKDPKASKRDVNAAVANGAKLLQIEHKISPEATEDFFG